MSSTGPTTGTWSFAVPTISAGAHSFVAKFEDAVGNAGLASSAFSYTLDSTGPAAVTTLAITSATDDQLRIANRTEDIVECQRWVGTRAPVLRHACSQRRDETEHEPE